MICCVGMTRISGRRTDDCGDLSVLSVLDKYPVSLSLSHHPNIIITGWYRDTRSHKTMQTEQYFLSEIVLPFCKNVLHIGYWHAGLQGTLWLCSRRSFIYGLTPSVTRSQTWDPRIRIWLTIMTWPRQNLNISPGPRAWHRVITRCQMWGCQLPSV